jgi:hypothetical protein
MGHPAEVARRLEAHQCAEVIVLEEVEQHVPIVEVPDLAGRRPVVTCRRGAHGRHGHRTGRDDDHHGPCYSH